MKALLSTAVLLMTFSGVADAGRKSKAKSAESAVPTTTDAHLHMFDFLQNGDYLEDGKLVEKYAGMALESGERHKQIDAALWAMDRANVSHALISGMPFVKKMEC